MEPCRSTPQRSHHCLAIKRDALSFIALAARSRFGIETDGNMQERLIITPRSGNGNGKAFNQALLLICLISARQSRQSDFREKVQPGGCVWPLFCSEATSRSGVASTSAPPTPSSRAATSPLGTCLQCNGPAQRTDQARPLGAAVLAIARQAETL